MKKLIKNLFCAVIFALICFGTSQIFATANFDLKSPTTSKPYLEVMDFTTSGTLTSTTKIIKNCKRVYAQVDVTSVAGTETLTLSLQQSLNDLTYATVSATNLKKPTNTIDSQYPNTNGTESGHIFSVLVGGTHTSTFGGAYAATTTGSTTIYEIDLPVEQYLKVVASLSNGVSGNNVSKWRVSFVDADPFGHNPKNP